MFADILRKTILSSRTEWAIKFTIMILNSNETSKNYYLYLK